MSDGLSPAEKILGQIAANRAQSRNRRIVGVMLTDDLHDFIDAAARARGISKSAFVRRAAASFAAHDAGLTYDEVMRGEVGVRPYGELGGAAEKTAASRNGEGFGEWQIGSLGR